MLIDSHCHLAAKTYPEGIDAVLERAHEAGVHAAVVVGVSGEAAAQEAVALAHCRCDVVATVGVHPHEAATQADELERLEGLLADPKCVAVGEAGLDFFYDFSPPEAQREVFRQSVALARRVGKPLVVHTRDADDETLEILESEGAREVGGVIHCFSSGRAFGERALELGFDLSFSGIVTYASAAAIQEVAAWAPLDRILVETDSPYLIPKPLKNKKKKDRPKRCEPAFVIHTARFLADLRGLSLDELARVTTENACRRFGPALAAAAGISG